MGIQGLLSFLEKASKPINISEYSGCTVVVDTYCWLHKGAFSCAEKLARGENTDQYVNYCMKYVNMLLSFNIKPILVFDGRHLPAKSETEKKRRELRESNRKRAAELLRLERDAEARSLIQRSVDVTHEMALNVIKQCRAQGVDCIVAPFEADAQLAYLNINGFAHIVITEDSDLMLFGCKLVLFKLDLNGNGILIEQQKIPLAMKQHPNQFSMDKFRYMCILSGCDYLKSLPGIGLAKACKFMKKTADDNIKRALTRLGAYLNMPNLIVTEDYRDKFVEADFMFKYQPVFDPITRRVVTLNPLPADLTNPLADTLGKDVSYQLALGNLNPFTLKQVDSWSPDEPQTVRTNGWKTTIQRDKSIWSKDYKRPPPLPPKKDPREVVRPTTKGKTATHPVTTLTQRITELPPKPNVEEEIKKLRESYGIKTAVAKLSETDEEGTSTGGSQSTLLDEDDLFQDIIKTPEKAQRDNVEFTVDDILNSDSSPVFEGKAWRNPFSSSSKQKKENQSKKPGGALDRFSKLKRTVVEEACIVQSRYFGNQASETNMKVEKDDSQKNKNSDDLSKSLEDILSSPLNHNTENPTLNNLHVSSPKNNTFTVTDLSETPKKSELRAPNRSIFSVSDIDTSSRKTNFPSPRKNIFSVTTLNQVESPFISKETSKPQSFLNIIDSLSKSSEDNEPKIEKPLKKLSSPSFKWQQPLLDFEKKEGNEKNSKSNNLTNSATCKGFIKSPQRKLPNQKRGSPASKKRSGTSLEKNSLKRRSSEVSIGQQSLFDMFAFQAKPKLKIQ